MTTHHTPSYLRDPLYKDVLQHLQVGAWEQGFSALQFLTDRYPNDKTSLEELRADMLIRSKIDEYEIEENLEQRKTRIKNWTIYGLGAVGVILLLVWAVGTYAGFISNQVVLARQQIDEQSEYLQLLATYRNAQTLLRAGRAVDSLALYEQVQSQVQANDYPREEETFVNLNLESEQARAMAVIENDYNQAVTLLSEGNRSDALQLFRKISLWNSSYRDVTLQIDALEKYFQLEAQVGEIEDLVAAGQLEVAIVQLEDIRAENPTFEKDKVEDLLFKVYLQAAQAILDVEETPEQLEIAEGYFSKALALRPQDASTKSLRSQARTAVEDALIETYLLAAEQALLNQEDSLAALQIADEFFFKASQVRPGDMNIAVKHEMARRYLEAIEDFSRGDWDLVITALEFVYSEDSGFASGTASQTLYDSYMARGNGKIGTAEYEAAMLDFQRAAEIANSTSESELLLIKARAEMARTLGLLARFEEAVQLYHEAVTEAALLERAQTTDIDVYNLLINAQAYLDLGNFKSAYTYYRNAFANLVGLLTTSKHVVQEGEYLTQLARQYGTTVEAIMAANNISSRRIEANQELIIPNLDEEP